MIFLTSQGENLLTDWLASVVEGFDDHDPQAWLSHAEAVAMNTPKGDDVVIEVRTTESLTGKPETFRLSPDSFFTFPPEA
jgi:hypothetical protein